MKVIKLRDGSAIFLEENVDINRLLGSNKRFVRIGNMIINRADITAVVNKEQFEDMMKLKNGMVLTSQGWLSSKEYQSNSFLKVQIPESLVVDVSKNKLEDTEIKKLK